MVFNKNISGYKNEEEFSKELNNKTVYQLNPMFKEFIFDLFGIVDEDKIIKCRVDYNKRKYDIVIILNGKIKYISIKKGIKNSMHVEGISRFIHFLIDNGVPREIIINYLKFHYADGTTNGTGVNRISTIEYKKEHQQEIDEINLFLNNEKLLLKVIDRFILRGNLGDKNIDAIIFGVIDDFIWIKKEDIVKVILSHINDYSSTVHFGPLTIQPLDRCLNRNPKHEKCRFCVQVKWYNLADDIIINMNNNIKQDTKYRDEPNLP